MEPLAEQAGHLSQQPSASQVDAADAKHVAPFQLAQESLHLQPLQGVRGDDNMKRALQRKRPSLWRVTASFPYMIAWSYFLRSSLMSTATSWATQLVSFQPSPTLKSKRL